MARLNYRERIRTFVSPRPCRGFVRVAATHGDENPRQSRGLTCAASAERGKHRGFTLVEMLVAMAITLVMMGAVVTLFANISNSVRIRRATIELSSQLRHVRNVLQQDLQGATCPGVTWQRPESNHGYIEIIEGQYREGNASILLDADPNNPNTGTLPPNWPPSATNPEIDHVASTIPSSNIALKDSTWATDGAGLGDADDILMLTVRNEHEPFVGKSPTNVGDPAGFAGWNYDSITSPLAEVMWFAVENPGYTDATLTDPSANHFFGEPGMRTIYRRTLLIAPWLDPYKEVDLDNNGMVTLKGGQIFKHVPGLLRMLPTTITQTMVAEAIASLISFQDRYDISARVEWDYTVGNWKIVANTLGDLTKRENRFCHFGYYFGKNASDLSRRIYPFAFISMGGGYSGSSQPVKFLSDPEIQPPNNQAQATANLRTVAGLNGVVVSYTNDAANVDPNIDRRYYARPFVYVAATPQNTPSTPATAQAILNDDGRVVRVVHGPAPLWGTRRGEDVMMTDALAFDLRVFDPGAPIFATVKKPVDLTKPQPELDVVLTPSDPGWRGSPTDGTDGAYMQRGQYGKLFGQRFDHRRWTK